MLLGADIEKSDARARDAKAVAGVGRAHQRVLHEVGGVGPDVGADIQHHVEAAGVARGPEAGDGGAVDAGQLAQPDHRQGHQRAGIAAADRARRLAAAHAFDRRPHRRALAVAHDLAGLVLHRHHAGGMADGAARRDVGAPREKLPQRVFGAVQDEVGVGIASGRLGEAVDHHRGTAIAAHRVDGNDKTA